jgi:hypothetical protein
MSQARALLGYEVIVPIAEGLKRLMAWYKAQGIPAEELLRHEVVRNWDVERVSGRI